MRHVAFNRYGDPTKRYAEWLDTLREKVIEEEFGYEPGEFTVYAESWSSLYAEGLSPRDAWQRALDGAAERRRQDDEERKANYARIKAEDDALLGRLPKQEVAE